MAEENKIADALQILESLGMPRAQQNDRSALCLLALLNLKKGQSWSDAKSPLVGITPMLEFALDHYGKKYAPNSRETFRRQTKVRRWARGLTSGLGVGVASAVGKPLICCLFIRVLTSALLIN